MDGCKLLEPILVPLINCFVGSNYLPWHSYLPFLKYCHFLCHFVPPLWVSLSMSFARKLLLLKSLFLDKKIVQKDLTIPHNFHFEQCLLHWMGGGGGGIGKCRAGGSKGIAPASFGQGLVSFWV
jgi:hypothetical protein